MGQIARLRKVGGSVMVAIPPAALEALQLKPNADVDVSVKDGRLVLEARARRRYTLEELLARCRPARRRSGEDEAWLVGRPVGKELI
jgi:antitoxin ChpS